MFIRFSPGVEVKTKCDLICMNTKTIEQLRSMRFLGVVIDNRLNWGVHTNDLSSVCSVCCFLLRWVLLIVRKFLDYKNYLSEVFTAFYECETVPNSKKKTGTLNYMIFKLLKITMLSCQCTDR